MFFICPQRWVEEWLNCMMIFYEELFERKFFYWCYGSLFKEKILQKWVWLWTLWNLFSCVTRCVACVFLQCVASGFPVRIMSRTRKYPFDLCFLVPTTHVILIISTEMTWHCPCKSPYCYVLLRLTAITNLLNKCSCGSYCSPHHST